MRVLINLEDSDDIREVYLDLDQPLEMLKYLIEAEFNITINNQTILYDNKILENDKFTLINYNIKEDEIIVVRNKQTMKNNNNKNNNIGSHNINTNNISKIFDDTMKILKNPQNPNNSFESRVRFESIKIKEFYINNPVELNILFNTDPDLAEVIVSMDDKRLEELLRTRMTKIEDKKKKEQEEFAKLMKNPDDKEAQKRIEEIIRLKNIDENLHMAHEYLPESFLPVHMLYINLEINKHKVVALVDTGAQTTVISENLAKKFEIFNLCDTRYSGIAKGVGTSKIIGKIHAAQMKIGESFVICKLTVIENNSVGFIFGLDNMRSHRCTIDLAKNLLIFPDAGINISFLSDGEIRNTKDLDDLELENSKSDENL